MSNDAVAVTKAQLATIVAILGIVVTLGGSVLKGINYVDDAVSKVETSLLREVSRHAEHPHNGSVSRVELDSATNQVQHIEERLQAIDARQREMTIQLTRIADKVMEER